MPSPLRRLFHYLPPPGHGHRIAPGSRVRVPFGSRRKRGHSGGAYAARHRSGGRRRAPGTRRTVGTGVLGRGLLPAPAGRGAGLHTAQSFEARRPLSRGPRLAMAAQRPRPGSACRRLSTRAPPAPVGGTAARRATSGRRATGCRHLHGHRPRPGGARSDRATADPRGFHCPGAAARRSRMPISSRHWRRWNSIVTRPICCTATPAPARQKSICAPSNGCCGWVGRRWCWFPRSP